MITMARNFIKIRCDECGNEQVTFSRASSKVECLVCGEPLAVPTGGAAEIQGEIVQQYEIE